MNSISLALRKGWQSMCLNWSDEWRRVWIVSVFLLCGRPKETRHRLMHRQSIIVVPLLLMHSIVLVIVSKVCRWMCVAATGRPVNQPARCLHPLGHHRARNKLLTSVQRGITCYSLPTSPSKGTFAFYYLLSYFCNEFTEIWKSTDSCVGCLGFSLHYIFIWLRLEDRFA